MSPLLLGLALLAAPAPAAETPRALLFAPDAKALDWNAFRALVSAASVRFTVALAPEQTPEAERAWLREAAAAGRLELALRLSHDPLAPLLQQARPDAFLERLAAANPAFRAAFGVEPRGFVAAAAALDKASCAALAASGMHWTAAGEAGGPRPWRAAGTLLAVPFRTAAVVAAETGEPFNAAVDETAALPPGEGLAVLAGLLNRRPARWTTVAEAAGAAEAPYVVPSTWPAWAGAEGWLAAPDRRRARELYALAVESVDRYQNSGSATVSRLDAAAAALDRAAAARNFRPGAPIEPLLADIRAAFKAAGEQAPDAGVRSDEPAASLLERGVAFEVPEPPSTAAWSPRALRVEREGPDVAATMTLRALTSDPAAPLGFSGAAIELYIDINGLAGMGSTHLLGERREVLRSRDSWEFAVTIDSKGAALWRVGAPAPGRLEDLPTAVDLKAGEIRVTLPGRRLRGNPSGWGYLLLAAPEGAPGQAVLLGDAADQKSLGKEGPPAVLKALRLLER